MSTTQNEKRITGQVKWFNIKAGYGFITIIDEDQKGKDIFVHFSSLKVENSQYRYLVQGEYVEFNLVKFDGEKYEYNAVNVSGIKDGPIMCESRRSSLNTRQEGERESIRPHEERETKRILKKTVPVTADEQGFEKVVKKQRQPRKTQSV